MTATRTNRLGMRVIVVGAMVFGGCDPIDDEKLDPGSLEQLDERQQGGVLVAELDLEDDVHIEFRELEGGSLIVSEVGPGDAASAVTRLAMDHHATPLEIFEALAPDADAPEVLRRDHADVADHEPRALANLQFRSTTGHEYATSCAYVSDKSWFDGLVSSTGWTWDWHVSSNFPYNGLGFRSTPTVDASGHISHVCNFSVAGGVLSGMNHFLYNDLDPGDLYLNMGIPTGYRSVTYTLGNGEWRAQAAVSNGGSGNFKLGAIAP